MVKKLTAPLAGVLRKFGRIKKVFKLILTSDDKIIMTSNDKIIGSK